MTMLEPKDDVRPGDTPASQGKNWFELFAVLTARATTNFCPATTPRLACSLRQLDKRAAPIGV